MKKMYVFLFVAVMLSVLLSACAPAQGVTQGFVDLPDTVTAGITSLIVAALAWVFAKLITLVPFLAFLRPFQDPLALAIAAELIALIESAVPDAYAGVAVLAIQLILAIIALVLTFSKLRERGVRAFQ